VVELATQCDADNPCVNGGQCVEVAEWYNKPYPHRICVCQWYYRGSHCERSKLSSPSRVKVRGQTVAKVIVKESGILIKGQGYRQRVRDQRSGSNLRLG
jgi:hypothetical protein